MAGREDEVQRKEERLKQSERTEPVTAGRGWSKQGRRPARSPGEGVRPQVRASQPLRSPAAGGWEAR